MSKRIEVIIPGIMGLEPRLLENILRNNCKVIGITVEFPPPIPIKTRKVAFGARREGIEEVVGYRPGGEPKIFLEIAEEEDRLYKTARSMLDYYDEAGPDLFRYRFGSLDLLEPCRKIIQEGEGNPHPWR